MIQLLDRLVDEQKQELVIVKMDIKTYTQIVSNNIEFEPITWSSEILWTKDYENFINLLKQA